MIAPSPANEAQRIAALRRYRILDTPAEKGFDDLTELAAQICQTPIALISLVDAERLWFKSRLGLHEQEISRKHGFCAHAILHQDEVFQVEDTVLDPRFADNPQVLGDPHLRFYAGAPLLTPEGHALGTLCVLDRSPRSLTSEQLVALRTLGRHVVTQMELVRQAWELKEEVAKRAEVERELNDRVQQLAARKEEADQILERAEKLQFALLSMFEDERRVASNFRASEERFRELAENIHEVFWTTDPKMKELLYVSPAYERIWGCSCASLYASPEQWRQMIHPQDQARVENAIGNTASSGSSDVTYRILRPDRTERWIHDRRFPVRNAAGEVHRIVGIAEDITERRRLENQFRAAQKMESIGQLAGGIAHDFNNILSAIVGNLELAEMEATDRPAMRERLGCISVATKRARDLVSQILTFSRQGNPDRKVIRLNDIVLEASSLLRSSMPAGIRIQLELEEVPTVLANATAVHQAVMNLGTNALHAMRGGVGMLRIVLRALDVDPTTIKAQPDLRPGRYVVLSVTDTGCGMDGGTLANIFQPFFTTKPVGEGTGLGLAVVHGIMTSHDGGISVESQPDAGTIFHLYFPVFEGAVAAVSPAVSPIPRGRGEHILFVDDEASLANVGKQLLQRLGYVVTAETDPQKAIAALGDQPGTFDLVITDLTMPGMDGVRLASQLLKLRPDLPLIITTGYGGLMTEEKLREAGFRASLRKPYDARELATTIDRVLHPSARG